MLPAPLAVLSVISAEARSGSLFLNLAVTLARVAAAFSLAMVLGVALGVAMGRNRTINRFCDPLLIVLLNLPALVVIVLAYIWLGLNDLAAILSVTLNKLPNTVVTLREGTRALDKSLEEMALVFDMPIGKKIRHVVLPQLAPYFAVAMRSGLSLVWKIVLIAELLGRSNGVGFEIGIAFQLFDVTRLLAYALPFVALMLAIETFFVQPFERHLSRWRLLHET
jgi:NitT/TauT family transport system permease protein